MGLHLLPLLGGEPAQLQQDRVRDGELADVVQRCRLPELLHLACGEPELLAEEDSCPADPLCVLERLVVAVLGRERKPVQGLEPGVVELPGALLQLRGALLYRLLENRLVVQLRLLPLPELREVADDADEEALTATGDLGAADLHGERGAVLAPANDLATGPDRPLHCRCGCLRS